MSRGTRRGAGRPARHSRRDQPAAGQHTKPAGKPPIGRRRRRRRRTGVLGDAVADPVEGVVALALRRAGGRRRPAVSPRSPMSSVGEELAMSSTGIAHPSTPTHQCMIP